MSDTLSTGTGPPPPRVPAELASHLYTLGESAYRYGDDPREVGYYARLAISAGRRIGWTDGGRAGTRAATTAVARAAAPHPGPATDATARRIHDTAAEIWYTAATLPTPLRHHPLDRRDLTQTGAAVVILGTAAYQDAWHASHRAHSAWVLDTLDEILDRPGSPAEPAHADPAPRWRQIRAAALTAIEQDRLAGPFHRPPAARAFPPPRVPADAHRTTVDETPRPTTPRRRRSR